MARLFAILALLLGNLVVPRAIPQSAGPVDDASFVDALQRIVTASGSRFRNIQGAIISNRRREYYYEAQVYLPGATYCQILVVTDSLVYDCYWEKSPTTGALFDELAGKIERGLDGEWSRQSPARKSGREVLFTRERDAVIQVIRETGQPVVHVFITPFRGSPTGVGEKLPKPPPM